MTAHTYAGFAFALALMMNAAGALAADAPVPSPARATPPAPAFINIAINVSDMDRSAKFYVEALGFTDGGEFKPDATAAKVYGLKGPVDIRTHNVRLGAISILLRQFNSPKTKGKTGKFPMEQLGLGNIAVSVKNMDEAAATVKRLGGTVDESTRALRAGVGPLMMFATDPDGIRIELLQF